MRERVEQGAGAPQRGGAGAPRSGSAGRVTLVLLVVLVALGVLGAGSMWALNGSQVPAVASTLSPQDQLATRICTAYQTHNYDLLIANIDPAPVPPTAPTDFTAAAQKAFGANLKALDSQSGAVTQCSFKQIAPVSAGHQHYGFQMTRAKGRQSTQVMDFVQEKDGTWKIARDSQFTPVG